MLLAAAWLAVLVCAVFFDVQDFCLIFSLLGTFLAEFNSSGFFWEAEQKLSQDEVTAQLR